MLDIKLFRESPNIIKASEKKRGRDTTAVNDVIKFDNQWRELLQDLEKMRHKRNAVSEKINQLKKAGKQAEKEIKEMRKVANEILALEQKIKDAENARDSIRYKIGNILHNSVPSGKEAKVVRTWGKIPKYNFQLKSHTDLLTDLNVGDLERAAKISGARFYFLKNELVLLNIAIQKFAMDLLFKKGYTPMYVPFMINKEAMKGAAELSDFEQTLYKIDGEDMFLIATAEQPLAAYFMDEVIDEAKLPIKFAGFSTNFRREAGAHGKDTKGIFRVHQFDKVEQYILCKPKDSWKLHEELIKNAEEIFRKLEIPYHIVNIAAEDMNDNAAKKYDIEAWMPAQKMYREMGSCSNCTDYQSRKLNIRIQRKSGEKIIIHVLNSTAVATERAITAILENHQQKDGSVKIPKALWKYTGFKEIKPKKQK